MSISTKLQVQKFEARTLPIKTVTVFADRAELKRTLKVILQEGLNNIEIDNVASSIESDSIRVDGHGNATIHEVQFKTEQVTQPEVDSPQVTELLKDLEDLKSKCAENEDMKQVYTKRLESLDSVINNLGKTIMSSDKNMELTKFDAIVVNTVDSVYGFHEKISVEVHAKKRAIEKDLKILSEKIQSIELKISNMRREKSSKKLISIVLGSPSNNSQVELEIAYQVFQASWLPTYDVRVQTTGDKASLKLTYFGNVRQTSGEDWNDVELSLSTGMPRLGGKLPELRTLRVQFARSAGLVANSFKVQSRKTFYPTFGDVESEWDASSEHNNTLFGADKPSLQVAKAEMGKSTLATTFSIPQKKTVPSDNSEHKVTIAVLDLDPVLHYDCVPSKNTNVFMSATAANSSTYPLMAGKASIFVDNCFSSKVGLREVAAGEMFDCALGVDSCIKVEYKPAHKYQQQVGMFSKSAITSHEQKISVKNTKPDPVHLTLFEHIPKSTDEKIKVKIISPEIKNQTGANSGQNQEKSDNVAVRDIKTPKQREVGAVFNDSNNLEWTVLVNGQEERELCIKWTAEYPASEVIEYREN